MKWPEEFKPLRKVEKLLQDKVKLFDTEQKVDWSTGELLAIKPGARGEVIDANDTALTNAPTRLQIAWKSKRNVPKKPSLLLVDDLLFGIDDGGVAACLEAKTGAEVWRERVGGNYSASPAFAEGRIYFFSEEGKTTVVEAGRQFKVVAENKLDDGFMASPAVDLFMNETRLAQVYYNIINNACDAMPDGGRVKLRFQESEREIITEIEDTGTGIAPEIAPRLFEAFATYGKAQGTGLGLSICKKIVEDHSGKISSRSEPGRGAIFSFSLPLHKEAA